MMVPWVQGEHRFCAEPTITASRQGLFLTGGTRWNAAVVGEIRVQRNIA
jgi:hypothetical protein